MSVFLPHPVCIIFIPATCLALLQIYLIICGVFALILVPSIHSSLSFLKTCPPPPVDLLLSTFYVFLVDSGPIWKCFPLLLYVFSPPRAVRSSATVSICPTLKEVHLDVGRSSLNVGHSEVNVDIAPWSKLQRQTLIFVISTSLGVCHNFEAKLR